MLPLLFLGGGEPDALRFRFVRCGDLLRLDRDFLCLARFGEGLGVDFLLSGDLKHWNHRNNKQVLHLVGLYDNNTTTILLPALNAETMVKVKEEKFNNRSYNKS